MAGYTRIICLEDYTMHTVVGNLFSVLVYFCRTDFDGREGGGQDIFMLS